MFKLRFWWAILRGFFTKPSKSSSVYFWVTPFDCDLYLHLNNGNYLRYMDLGRWHWTICSGALKPFFRAKVRPMAVGVEIRYMRSLPLFCRFRLDTELDSSKGKTVRVVQRFYRGDSMVAEAFVTAVFVLNGKAQELSVIAPFMPESWRERVLAVRT